MWLICGFCSSPLQVLAPVDKYAEIEYSMVASPVVSKAFVDFGLKVISLLTLKALSFIHHALTYEGCKVKDLQSTSIYYWKVYAIDENAFTAVRKRSSQWFNLMLNVSYQTKWEKKERINDWTDDWMNSILWPGRVLQHRQAQGASVLPASLRSASAGQQHALHRCLIFHRQLCILRLQQCRSLQPLHHRWHGE